MLFLQEDRAFVVDDLFSLFAPTETSDKQQYIFKKNIYLILCAGAVGSPRAEI